MMRFYFKKLVRDKIVENCLADSLVLHTEYRALDDNEYLQELKSKVAEEAQEIPGDSSDRDEQLAELADLQGVVDAMRDSLGFSESEVRAAADEKSGKKGGFTNRHYIEYVDLDPTSEWVAVLREQPDKYREIVVK